MSLLAAVTRKLDKTLQATVIGNIGGSAVSVRVTDVQLRLAITLSWQSTLTGNLRSFGITSSYMELRRSRISAAAERETVQRNIGQFDCKKGLVQVVANKFDTQINSQNGLKATHGMAMIVTQTNQPKPGHVEDKILTIKRLQYDEIKSNR